MPNQADTQRVVFNVIEPMKRHWAAEFDADTISDFVDDLYKFSAESLKNAMADMRREHKRKPSLSHIFDACRNYEPSKNSHENRVRNEWEERDERVNNMVSDYVTRFKNISTIWHESVLGGWEIDLWRYIYSMASMQAQMIVGDRNIGWDGVVMFGATTLITDEMRNQLIRQQRQQAETGSIEVSIPTGRIAEWKRHAACKIGQQKKSLENASRPKAEIAKSILNPGLDKYIEMLRA